MTNHERTALRLLDYGFEFDAFADVWPTLIEWGLIERRDDSRLHVTGAGRRAVRTSTETPQEKR
jgi:hypothetical protein